MTDIREQIAWQREVAAVFVLDCEPKRKANECADTMERLTAEHGDMNVHCVKLEKENERLLAVVREDSVSTIPNQIDQDCPTCGTGHGQVRSKRLL